MMKALGIIGLLSLVLVLIWTQTLNPRADHPSSSTPNERATRSDRPSPTHNTPADRPERSVSPARTLSAHPQATAPQQTAATRQVRASQQATPFPTPPSRTTGRPSPADDRSARSSSPPRSSSSASLAEQEAQHAAQHEAQQTLTQANPEQANRLSQPAVWAKLDDVVPAGSEMDIAIQKEAERLLEEVAAIPADNEPEVYREKWEEAVSNSDQLFRAKYGVWKWMQHHIHANHLANSAQPAEK
jgi:FtsZ-interacting cell division protein ZipA